MKRSALILAATLLLGCEASPPAKPTAPAPGPQMTGKLPPTTTTADKEAGDGLGTATAVSPTAVTLTDGKAELNPANSKIEFIGRHSGDKPDPRLGGFEKFSGQLTVDADGKSLTAISFTIDANSVWTEIGEKLTNHLKNQDFFDVKEFPEIAFKSTQVENAEGKTTVTGDLTLHGVTKPITVPATVTVANGAVKLDADFSIDRTEFGMTYGEGKVENMVSLIIKVGEKTAPKTAAPPAQ